MKKLKRSLAMMFSSFLMLASPTYAADQGKLNSKLSGFQTIADDVFSFVMWGVWTVGPILFVAALFKHMKSNDPGDKKDAKKWMTVIGVCFIAAQLAVWFLRDYLAPKFS